MTGATTSGRLEDQAAAAALYVTDPVSKTSTGHPLLDEDGKLSSAGAATSLKYAKAQDLPSFPSAGLKLSSAGAAASLADGNKKSFEHWKPGTIPAANKAAMLAKDYEMDPLWQPELSAAGSRAALLAHRDPPNVEPYNPAASAQGSSAAGQALRSKPVKIPEREVPDDVHQKALLAATGAMSASRPRAGSAPTKPAPTTNSTASWALKAATKSHRDAPPASGLFASGDPGFEAARIQNVAKDNVNRKMYGSAPPVSIEVEEKNRQDMLRASAVAMAQKMYAIQQQHIDEASRARQSDSQAAAGSMHRRGLSNGSDAGSDSVTTSPRYENLEEAARRLAQERLAKLHDEHAEYRQYYGAKEQPPRSRLSTRLRRGGSFGTRNDDSDSDEEQSRRIRRQMSLFQSKLAEVDKNKRQADRDKLLEAAHKNVEARLAKMDEQVLKDTGKLSPAQREAFERQARERAQREIDSAMKNVGKVPIGGGKYLEKEEVDAIARARLQPTLDDINEKAELQRARDAEIRAEQERLKAEAEREKARDAEIKAELKAAKQREQQEQKAQKNEEKRMQKEQAAAEKDRQRQEKEEKRKSKEVKSNRFSTFLGRSTTGGNAGANDPAEATAAPEVDTKVDAVEETTSTTILPASGTVHDAVTVPTQDSERTKSIERPVGQETSTPTVPTAEENMTPSSRRDSKVKSWLKTHLRGSSKTPKDEPTSATSTGADKVRDDSVRDVAMAGRNQESGDLYGSSVAEPVSPIREQPGATAERSPSISSASSENVGVVDPVRTSTNKPASESSAGRSGLKSKLLQKMRPNKKESETALKPEGKGSTDDDFEEARDTFEEKLSHPPNLATDRPRSSHEQSKFKEEL